ncbi:MAG: hypothetical protein HZA81_04335 [Candidatus Taylorbacteria bacterium]|nr:hypothetical protein [Candidatus Taylorbacteria bacterium]
MNTRRALALVVLLLVAIGIFLFFWLFKKDASNPVAPFPDSGAPIFGESGGSLPPANPPAEGGASEVILPPTPEAALIASCDSPVSIERNDCVKKAAVKAQNQSLCAAILGTLGQTDCRNAVLRTEDKIADISMDATVRYDFEFAEPVVAPAEPVDTISTRLAEAFEKAADAVREARQNPDPRYTADGFIARFSSSSPMLYSFSRSQALPGTELVAQGLGFTKTGNEIHIGNYAVSGLASADGMTIRFTLPGSMEYGTYDTWVTNERGSSRNMSQPIRLTITDSPLSPPTITGISPSVPTLSDTVTVYGSNLRGALGIYTSLGVLENVYAGDSSLTFKISDFPMIEKIKDIKGVKGNLVAVTLIVGTPQGYNQEPFLFNVQF